MLTAFLRSRHRQQHQDEQLAKESTNTSEPAIVLPIDNDQAIEFALARSSLTLLQQIVTRGGTLDNIVRTKTPLMRAVQNDNAQSVSLLLAAGAEFNKQTRSGENALLLAVRENKLKALKALLKAPTLDTVVLSKAVQLALRYKRFDAFLKLAKYMPLTDKITLEALHRYLYQAIKKRDLATIDRLFKFSQVDVSTKFRNRSLVFWALNTNHVATARRLLLASASRYGIPFSSIIQRPNHFDSMKKCREFYHSNGLVSYLESHALCQPVTIAALRILDVNKKVLAQDRANAFSKDWSESAMEEKAVRHANQHFTQTVQPLFAKQFAALGMMEIEKQIRQQLLAMIRSQALENRQDSIVTFIDEKQVALINAEDAAMKESLTYFTQAEPAQAAWRGYNPFALVSGTWPNLFTTPAENSEVFSTAAATEGRKIHSHEASNMVRERVAYYYLAVIDNQDGNDESRQNRIANFIGLLAEIRNAHGRDDPSCFPGYLTRIAQMGHYHSLGMLPEGFKKKLAHFFKSKVFQAFKDNLLELAIDEQQALLRSLVDLNQETALDIIKNPENYPQDLLPLRQAFIDALGKEYALLEEFNRETFSALDADDLIYIQQHLLDITRGDIALALAEYAKRFVDRPVASADMLALNPYQETQPDKQRLFDKLLNIMVENSVFYSNSLHQLRAAAMYCENKVNQMFNQSENAAQYFKELIDSLECEEQAKPTMISALQQLIQSFGFVPESQNIQNPYLAQIATLQPRISATRHPLQLVQLEKRLRTLEQKRTLFDKILALLNEKLTMLAKERDFPELLTAMVEYIAFHEKLDRDDFTQEWSTEHADLSLLEQCFAYFDELELSGIELQLSEVTQSSKVSMRI